MELKYYIGAVEISEPIGFDSFRETLKRTEHHGIVRALSVEPLEFYDNAFTIVSTAYNADIDTEMIFKAEQKCDGEATFITIFSGIIDLSTYEEKDCRCRCSVGHENTKETLFNNRSETPVNVERLTTLDAAVLTPLTNLNIATSIPAKGILLQSKLGAKNEVARQTGLVVTVETVMNVTPQMETTQIEEFGTSLADPITVFTLTAAPTFNQFTNDKAVTPYSLTYYYDIEITNLQANTLSVSLMRNNTQIGLSVDVVGAVTLPILFAGEITVNETAAQRLYVKVEKGAGDFEFEFVVKKGAYVNYNYLEKKQSTAGNIALIHEVLSRTAQIISGMSVKSDYYGRPDSQINPAAAIGSGSLKALTTGMKLRNAVQTDGALPTLKTSFKDLFLSLRAIDNVGWAFEDAGGDKFIRVEPMIYFYDNTPVLTITNPADYSKAYDPNRIYSRLKIGYSKYAETGEVNSIDTFHTIREYTTTLKTIDRELVRLSSFVACPYAIEFTRRKTLNPTTGDWVYDENIFVLELRFVTSLYTIKQGMTLTDDTIIDPDTIYNAALSPARNAINHLPLMFAHNSGVADLRESGSFRNVGARGERLNQPGALHSDPADEAVLFENGILPRMEPIMKAETVTFNHPITFDDWEDLKANPYGLITVNASDCWIDEASRNILTGMTDFKLTPKN